MKASFSLLFLCLTIKCCFSAPVETRFSIGSIVLGAKQSSYRLSSEQFLKELRIRTHIDPKDQHGWTWLKSSQIHQAPPFIWIIVGNNAKISEELTTGLQRFLFSGGTVLIEAERSPQAQHMMNELRNKVFYKRKISIVKKNELITRTYYILPESTAKTFKTIQYSDRILWIESSVPILNQIKPNYDANKEAAIRKATNVMLYTLTGSYKDDLTHLKYLMRRKKY